MNTGKELEEFINNYPTKYKEGFLSEEQKAVLEKFPNINMDKYNDAMMGNTCIMKEDKIVTYHCDIITALRCGIENRKIKYWEWD